MSGRFLNAGEWLDEFNHLRGPQWLEDLKSDERFLAGIERGFDALERGERISWNETKLDLDLQ